MECYYTDEVIELLEEELQFHKETLEGSSEQHFDKHQYAILIIKHLLDKVKELEVKEFNYSE